MSRVRGWEYGVLAAVMALPFLALAASDGRSYVSGYFALMLDDINSGIIQKFEGGDIEGDVVAEPPRGAPFQVGLKHIRGVKYEDISVSMGLSMGEPVRTWIETVWNKNYTRKDGEIQAFDYRFNERARLTFKDALITEITFPALDGASKDPAYMTLKITPDITRVEAAQGGKIDRPPHHPDDRDWMVRDFRVRLVDSKGGAVQVPADTVSALRARHAAVRDPVSGKLAYSQDPCDVELANVRVMLPESDSAPLAAWLAQSRGAPGDRRTLVVDYLDRHGNVVVSVSALAGASGLNPVFGVSDDKIRRVKFDMYLENLVAKFGG